MTPLRILYAFILGFLTAYLVLYREVSNPAVVWSKRNTASDSEDSRMAFQRLNFKLANTLKKTDSLLNSVKQIPLAIKYRNRSKYMPSWIAKRVKVKPGGKRKDTLDNIAENTIIDGFSQRNDLPVPKDHGSEQGYVLIIAYKAMGSSSLIQDVLSRNPAVFYAKDPLDSLDTSGYRLLDSRADVNIAPRDPPNHDTDTVVDLISSLLSCSFSNLPKQIEVGLQKFWTNLWQQYVPLFDLTKCLSDNGIDVGKCQYLYLTDICPTSTDIGKPLGTMCLKMLQFASKLNTSMTGKYAECLLAEIDQTKPCVSLLQQRCQESTIRVIETQRITMNVVETFLQKDTNLKVLHLLPDPRPVWLARMGPVGSRTALSYKELISRAIFYCDLVYSDVQTRKILEGQYGIRIKEIIHGSLIADSLKSIKDVYTFLELPFTNQTEDMVKDEIRRSSQMDHVSSETSNIQYNREKADEICADLLKKNDRNL